MAKNSPKWKKNMPVMLHILGTMHHMIVILFMCFIYGTHVWMMIDPGSFFHFFLILIFQVVSIIGGLKGQNMVLRNYTSFECHLSVMVCMCKMIISPGVFSFFQNFDFRLWGVKGQKMVQNDKKLPLWCSISREPYMIWLSFSYVTLV